MSEADGTEAVFPPGEVLRFWETSPRVERLRRAVKVALESNGVTQAKFANDAENRFAPDGVEGLRDALGRFHRNGPGKSVPAPIKCHVFMVTLFYAFQRRLTGDVLEKLSQHRSLFGEYDELLAAVGFPLLGQLAGSTARTNTRLGPVKPVKNLEEVGPIDIVLSLVNVSKGRHAAANERFYEQLPHVIPSYQYQWFVIATLSDLSASPALSLLVLRSGHQDDYAMTYTHRQKRPRVAQGMSNGVVCPTATGETLFGGFKTGTGMETIFIPGGQEGRDQLDVVVDSIGPNDRPYRCAGVMLRSTKLLYDDNPWYLKQDLSLCSTLAADPKKALQHLSETLAGVA